MTNECIPYYEGPYTQTLTVHAGYAMTGKTFAGPITGLQTDAPGLATDPLGTGNGGNLIVGAAPVDSGEVSGVINWDVASASKAVLIRGAGTVLPVTSASAITAGDLLSVTTAGKVQTASSGDVVVGKALNTVTGANLDVEVLLYDLNPAIVAA